MHNDQQFLNPTSPLLIYLITLNTALLVACNAAGSKMIDLPGGLAASAVVIPYALSFLFTDLISGIFGRDQAKMAVRIGFVGLILSVSLFMLAIYAPAAPFWKHQSSYENVLGIAPRLLAGGWLSYLVSQHLDVWIFHTLKKITKGKHLWLRNNLSTMVSQLIDTCIFVTIAFYGQFPLWPAILGQYLIKIIIALLDTPIMYLATKIIRNRLVKNKLDEATFNHDIKAA